MRLLLVDDDEDLRGAYAMFFQERGLMVLEAANGADGVAQARANRPDLILMDLNMPVMGGLEAIEKLKGDPRTRAIPVIVLSGNDESDLMTAERAGCHSLRKPCGFADLETVIQSMANDAPQRDSKV